MGDASVVYVHGRRACPCQAATLPMIEARLRAIGAITTDLFGMITQQAYSAGVAASAGTHDGGGVWDVKASLADTPAKRRAWRESGVAMWYRPYIKDKWPAHGHGVWIGCPHLQGKAGTNGKTWVHGALKQVEYYRLGLDGLAGKGKDAGPLVRPIVTWQTALADWKKANSNPAPARPAPIPATPMSEEDEIMALSKETLDAIAKAVWTGIKTGMVDGKTGQTPLDLLAADKVQDSAQSAKLADLDRKVNALAGQVDKLVKKAGA